jgi:hypothetical protein
LDAVAEMSEGHMKHMTQAIKLHTQLAPTPPAKPRRMTQMQMRVQLLRARDEMNRDVDYASRLIEEVIEDLRP